MNASWSRGRPNAGTQRTMRSRSPSLRGCRTGVSVVIAIACPTLFPFLPAATTPPVDNADARRRLRAGQAPGSAVAVAWERGGDQGSDLAVAHRTGVDVAELAVVREAAHLGDRLGDHAVGREVDEL